MQTKAQQSGHDFSTGPYIEYDARGNKTYFEDSDGYWEKREYDRNGNHTYLEDSTGDWAKSEYDARGNRTYCGYWAKTEYDARSKVISTESGIK